nr:T9SS type A sorting domain-containing protein [Prolixibacteraceae bacterium]
ISESIIDWWIGPYNTIATADAGNGTVLAVETMGMRPVFVRWDADSEFYPGSADMPFGPRTFFGLDGDGATDAEGNTLWQYSKYTELGMQVFLNEVAFLTGTLEDKTSAREMNLNARIGWNPANGQLSVEMNQLAKVDVLDLMGRTIYTSSVRQDRADINLSHAGKGLFVVRIINNNQQSYTRKIRMQ